MLPRYRTLQFTRQHWCRFRPSAQCSGRRARAAPTHREQVHAGAPGLVGRALRRREEGRQQHHLTQLDEHVREAGLHALPEGAILRPASRATNTFQSDPCFFSFCVIPARIFTHAIFVCRYIFSSEHFLSKHFLSIFGLVKFTFFRRSQISHFSVLFPLHY